MKWISIKDRLPDNDYVLVVVEFLDNGEKVVDIDHISEFSPKWQFEGYHPYSDKNKRFRKITHWMPLPKPPTI